jgi:cytochrome c-type biogenesis protein CcmH/NrfF
VIAILFLSAPIFAQQTAVRSPRATALGKRVKCMCGGCNDAAGLCYHSGGTFSGPCDTALGMLKEIDEHVARGESDGAILKAFVQEYGPTVLIEPPKSGFNLTAWIMPVAVPLFALGALYGILRRWHEPRAGTPAARTGVPPDILARVQREAEKDEL